MPPKPISELRITVDQFEHDNLPPAMVLECNYAIRNLCKQSLYLYDLASQFKIDVRYISMSLSTKPTNPPQSYAIIHIHRPVLQLITSLIKQNGPLEHLHNFFHAILYVKQKIQPFSINSMFFINLLNMGMKRAQFFLENCHKFRDNSINENTLKHISKAMLYLAPHIHKIPKNSIKPNLIKAIIKSKTPDKLMQKMMDIVEEKIRLRKPKSI